MTPNLLVKKYNIPEVISYLEDNGYIVRKIKNYKSLSSDAIISLFYDRLEKVTNTVYSVYQKQETTLKEDRAALVKFQDKLIKEGFTKKAANLIAYNLICKIFSNYDKLGVKKPLENLADVFSSNRSWILFKLAKIDQQNKVIDANSNMITDGE